MSDPAQCPLIDDAVSVAAGAARSGGAVLISTDHATLDIEETELASSAAAEHAAQAAAVDDVRAVFPDHVVVGEDGMLPGDDHEHVWFVDGLHGSAVSVALRCREFGADEVVAAAVYDPLHDELYCAGAGQGATANGAELRVSNVTTLQESVVVDRRRSGGGASPHAPGLVLSHLAAGGFTGYVEGAMAAWDISAGQLIVEEAGGCVTDFSGRRIDQAAVTDVVASNGKIHDALLNTLRP